jgi:hypothetical protein
MFFPLKRTIFFVVLFFVVVDKDSDGKSSVHTQQKQGKNSKNSAKQQKQQKQQNLRKKTAIPPGSVMYVFITRMQLRPKI